MKGHSNAQHTQSTTATRTEKQGAEPVVKPDKQGTETAAKSEKRGPDTAFLSGNKRSVLILQRPRQSAVPPPSISSHCGYCQSRLTCRHVLSDLPLCAVDLYPPTTQTATKVALCRHRVVLTRDDLSAAVFPAVRSPKAGNRTIETMSSDSTAASEADPEISSAVSSGTAFLIERCSVVSSELSLSTKASGCLTLSGADISLLQDFLAEMAPSAVETASSSAGRLRVQIGPRSRVDEGAFHVFVHRPVSSSAEVSSELQVLSEWRKQLRASLPILPEKKRLIRFLCDNDEHFQLSDDPLEFKRFISDFLRPATCVDVLIEVCNGIHNALALRIRTGETAPPLTGKRPRKWTSSSGKTTSSPSRSSSASLSPATLAAGGVSVSTSGSASLSPCHSGQTLDGDASFGDGWEGERLLAGDCYDVVLDTTCPMRPALAASYPPARGFTPSCLPHGDFRRDAHWDKSEAPAPSPSAPWQKYYWDCAPLLRDYYWSPCGTPFFRHAAGPHSGGIESPRPSAAAVDPAAFENKRFPNISFSIGPCAIAAQDILCCFWDLESTGLKVSSDQVIQIGCTLRVFHRPGSPGSTPYFSLVPGLPEAQHDFSLYVNTDLEIPEEISALTNITNQLLDTQGVDLASALRLWHSWIDDIRMQLVSSTNRACELWMIAHNGNQFDIPLLFIHELQRLKWSPGTLFKQMGVDAIVDSVVLSRALFFAEQELDGQKMARVVSRSHRLSDLYWNSFHESMPNQHNALYDAKAVSMVMSQEPFLNAWRTELVAWRLSEYVSAWYRAHGSLHRKSGFENIINRLLSETAATLPPEVLLDVAKRASPSPSPHSTNSSIAIWRSFRERSKLQAALQA
eukprot:Gregarina_sp_Poly_1__615@NODE_1145_length_4946_cov_113_398032_g789_i0_p1_GENE_NODE_1145_length_4946_cov_113_398032_g789_i0NODE_1145_length_4946_cov_113_398032_g789_i0_p1_ORF_typecomplete_len855_score120_96RNase_T/PF00929_24/4_4e15DUF5051/PF16473_5/0_012DUF2480/PF10652_9/0_14_NODE_1145_length_4946_cov_113_398032_g789_i013513915